MVDDRLRHHAARGQHPEQQASDGVAGQQREQDGAHRQHGRLGEDHAAKLVRGGADGAQQGHLAGALLEGEAEGGGDAEHHDEDDGGAEDRREDDDGALAGEGAGQFGQSPAFPGQHLGAVADLGAHRVRDRGGPCAGGGQHADGVDPAPGEGAGLVVREEHGGVGVVVAALLGDAADLEPPDGALDDDVDLGPRARAGAPGEVRVEDDLAAGDGGFTGGEGIGGEPGGGPAVAVRGGLAGHRLAVLEDGGRDRHVADGRADALDPGDLADEAGVDAVTLGQGGGVVGLSTGDDDRGAVQALWFGRHADARLHQAAAADDDRGAEEHGEEGRDEARPAELQGAQCQAPHQYRPPEGCAAPCRWVSSSQAPSRVIRAATASAVGRSSSPAKAPSARKTTRSA